jgi:peptidoglycan L-alanyl-D-glutamate endopeptidase CwlK
MINSRDFKDLLPQVADLAKQFVAVCESRGLHVLITSTYRDKESQNALYAIGRTTPGKRVTNAKGGDSMHNYKIAFDFVPMLYGKPAWNELGLFTKCGAVAKSVGLEWGGDWKTFKDLPHCQFTGGLTLSDFRAGKTLTKTS